MTTFNALIGSPLGKLLSTFLLWALGISYAAGTFRAEHRLINARLDRIEATLDVLSRELIYQRPPAK